jgi:hypothetical protein
VLNKSFAANGWRVGMLLSAVIIIPALVARYKLADSLLFERLKQREQLASAPSLAVFRTHAAPLILVAVMSAFMQIMANLPLLTSHAAMPRAGSVRT